MNLFLLSDILTDQEKVYNLLCVIINKNKERSAALTKLVLATKRTFTLQSHKTPPTRNGILASVGKFHEGSFGR